MESLEIIKIKIKGIIDCIKNYTSEPSINNILKECENALKSNNIEVLLFSCEEMSTWYDENITLIKMNDFVYNKDSHIKNVNLIKEITKKLQAYYDENKNLKKITTSKQSIVKEDVIINILNRFHFVVKQLRDRHDNRETLDVTDEYDVQDLLHSLLYLHCEDIRDEEWSPSYAGKCSRQDFLLKNEKIVIETKKTRKGLDAKKLSDELIIDIARYKTHPDCKTLICFVYDPDERIKNPRGIESDLTKQEDGINIIVIIKP